MSPLVTVVTATTGNPLLKKCVESVRLQSHRPIQHLIVVDGPDHYEKVKEIFEEIDISTFGEYDRHVIYLPYSIGKDRWNGHRIYAAGTYIADGEYLIFLDDDNYLEPDHVENCLKAIQGKDWSYSLRSLVSPDGTSLGRDDCESLGKWASVLHPNDYFIDVNCYFLPKKVAVAVSHCWNRKFREPGQPEVDRVLCQTLRSYFPNFDCSYKYSVNYTVGNSALSVQPDFFKKGNAEMLRRYNGALPWVK